MQRKVSWILQGVPEQIDNITLRCCVLVARVTKNHSILWTMADGRCFVQCRLSMNVDGG